MAHSMYLMNLSIMYYSIGAFFFIRGDNLLRFLNSLSKVKNGYLKNYMETIESIDYFTKVIIYSDFVMALCLSIENYRKSMFCDNGKSMRDSHYVCGSIALLWYPLEINQKITPLLAIFNAAFIVWHIPVLSSTTSLYFACSLLVVRIKHVGKSLRKLNFDIEESKKTKSELLQCVENYTEIIRLVREMNESVGFIFAPSHNAYNHVMLGICGYIIIKDMSFIYIFQLLMWILVQWVPCSCGQNLVDANLGLREELYNIPWYDMSPSLRSTFINFQAQVNLPLRLKIEPIHTMELYHFTEIMKGAYTFLMFLLQM